MIDSTVVRAHQCAAGAQKKGSQGLGRSKGGLTTKIHAVSVNETTVVNFLLSPGNCADCPVGKELLESWYHPETKSCSYG